MPKFFTNTFASINLYKKPSVRSELVSQMIYGDSFSVVKKTRKWLKIKIKEDGYLGFIIKKNYTPYIKPTHKIHKLSSKIYRFPNRKKEITELSFGSKLRVKEKKSNYFKFDKGWINQKDVKHLSYKEKNVFKRIKLFKNIKYKWGGKSHKGIDCSALIQVCLNFNNKFCPRDTKDQVKYFKKNSNLKNLKKNDIIYWNGHVAVVLSKNKLIHAYGPAKKTVIMNTNTTIKKIRNTANLNVIGIKRF